MLADIVITIRADDQPGFADGRWPTPRCYQGWMRDARQPRPRRRDARRREQHHEGAGSSAEAGAARARTPRRLAVAPAPHTHGTKQLRAPPKPRSTSGARRRRQRAEKETVFPRVGRVAADAAQRLKHRAEAAAHSATGAFFASPPRRSPPRHAAERIDEHRQRARSPSDAALIAGTLATRCSTRWCQPPCPEERRQRRLRERHHPAPDRGRRFPRSNRATITALGTLQPRTA